MRRHVAGTASVAYVAVVILFLFLPVAIVAAMSFNASSIPNFPIRGLTVNWYHQFFSNPIMVNAAVNSALVAAVTAIITLALGTLTAWIIVRDKSRLGTVIVGATLIPVALPPIMVAVALLTFFSQAHIVLSLWTVTIGHILLSLPFVVITVTTRLASIGVEYEEAAQTLGASRLQTLRRVTLPLLRPALIGAALLVAAFSLDEFVVAFFTLGASKTLPIEIWGEIRLGVSPAVNAVSTLMYASTVVILLVVRRFAGATLT